MTDRPTCLAQYPYVVVRVACNLCPQRKGAYRLARLAEKLGAETPLHLVLERIAFDCPYPAPHRARGNQYHPRCHARFVDLDGPVTPPDLPPGMNQLRVIVGGKS